MKIILASASPRRKELLKQIGLEYEVLVSDAEEKASAAEPAGVVEELAVQKAENVYRKHFLQKEGNWESELLIISADTIVACDGRILGKPKDAEDAKAMLRLLQGRGHEVYTGVTFLYRRDRRKPERSSRCQEAGQDRSCQEAAEQDSSCQEALKQGSSCQEAAEQDCSRPESTVLHTFHEATRVHFYPMTEEEIAAYVATGDPLDKAGAYGIQGLCARYISGIEGDYNNVVGLPVGRLYQELKRFLQENNGK